MGITPPPTPRKPACHPPRMTTVTTSGVGWWCAGPALPAGGEGRGPPQGWGEPSRKPFSGLCPGAEALQARLVLRTLPHGPCRSCQPPMSLAVGEIKTVGVAPVHCSSRGLVASCLRVTVPAALPDGAREEMLGKG